MKKIILFLFAIALFASCDRGDTPDNKGQIDPNAMILIRPAAGVRAQIGGLSALEVVEQGATMKWQSYYASNQRNEVPQVAIRGFADFQRCFDTPALKMAGFDIINPYLAADGSVISHELMRDFLFAFSVYITDVNNDTIAHVPDAVISAARPLITAAYNDNNFTEVYRLFDEAFTFLPIAE